MYQDFIFSAILLSKIIRCLSMKLSKIQPRPHNALAILLCGNNTATGLPTCKANSGRNGDCQLIKVRCQSSKYRWSSSRIQDRTNTIQNGMLKMSG
jgi:hypothetical protein